MKINKVFFAKAKNPGVSLLIALCTSALVLFGAMYTILSVKKSLESSTDIERSTQLFFAAESGIEAAFFHHHARGAGTDFVTTPTPDSQKIEHPHMSAETDWKLLGRVNETRDRSGDTVYSLMDLLKEGESVQVPLYWDTSNDPTDTPNTSGSVSSNYVGFVFSRAVSDLSDGDAKDKLVDRYGTDIDVPAGFDFDNADIQKEILVDWSFSRKHPTDGVQMFSPKDNVSCSGADLGFICENQLDGTVEILSNNGTLDGRILPGMTSTSLAGFFSCPTCSEYSLTFRSILPYEDTVTGDEIVGVPYEIFAEGSGFPQKNYEVQSNVVMGDFSQRISIEVPEKSSIGAFNYVIFD